MKKKKSKSVDISDAHMNAVTNWPLLILGKYSLSDANEYAEKSGLQVLIMSPKNEDGLFFATNGKTGEHFLFK